MSKLNVDQKSIFDLFSDKKADFLIPDYQRPYAWSEEQCLTLWDDIFSFSFPDNNFEEFDDNEEYFLGSIVTYKNEKGISEVIDGQQRLTTLMLFLRAFYDKFQNMKDTNSILTKDRIEKCIWKTDTFGVADKNKLKIDSEVATDNDKSEFLNLLKTGKIEQNSKSQYVLNYKFFITKIESFLSEYPSFFPYLPARILSNCILLPIEAESQDTALRIFSTLNDRGLPLSDADIFKAQLYKNYKDKGEKDEFISEWKSLEQQCSEIFKSSPSPMDELFTKYMYFLRAKEGNKKSTTESLRKFYEKNKYQYLKDNSTLKNLKSLINFWRNVSIQNENFFSNDALKCLYVLNYAPNNMWQNITSVYFLERKDKDDMLDQHKFIAFLRKITSFIFSYTITTPGVNALRTPIYDEMVNLTEGNEVSFHKFKFNRNQTRIAFENYNFTNQRASTRSMLTWYAFNFEGQKLLHLNTTFDIEHIYAKKRQEIEHGLEKPENLELLGNKILLESSINIRASDYRFEDKKKIYSGEIRRGSNKKESMISEIKEICQKETFNEIDLLDRNKAIIDFFINSLEKEGLLPLDDN